MHPCVEGELKAKHLKTANDVNPDKALYDWFVQARSEGLLISYSIIKDQAEKFNKQINRVLVSGGIRSADRVAASEYPDELKSSLEEGGYVPEEVDYNDETGLGYKMIPGRTLATKDDTHRR